MRFQGVSVTVMSMALCNLFMSGCASSPKKSVVEVLPDRVIARIDDLGSRPDWLEESKPFVIDEDRVISLGETVIPADHRLDAAYRIAQNNAAAAVASAIERRLEFIFQNAEEGTSVDTRAARFIGSEVTRLVTSALQPGGHYWEKVVTQTDYGHVQVKYRVFATVEMPESDFKHAIVDALRRNAGKAGLSAEFAEKVDQQWERMTAPDRLREQPSQELPKQPEE